MTTSIAIGIRVRPFNQRELKYGSSNIVLMPPDKPGTVALKVVRQGRLVADPPREFHFDHTFWTHEQDEEHKWADQAVVYEALGKPALQNVAEGYHSTLFAYGQTGSGKTYTMAGYPGDEGIIPRLCEDLFKTLAEMTSSADSSQTSVELSYIEIYNENVKDLLNPASTENTAGLKVRQHPKTGVFVEGLRRVQVDEAETVLRLLDQGNMVRSVAATQMNAASSRSHAILTLTVSSTIQVGNVVTGKYSRLTLVDLAGSERAASTGARGTTLAEGANINKSLSTLGMVLSRLADQAETGKQGLPVPFRDSSLTFLLQDSFGGNSKTSMLANISPADVNFDETLSTLRFAQVTKRVKNKAVVNENPAARLIRELTEELNGLKEKLKNLKQQQTVSSPRSNEEHEKLQQMIADSEAAQQAIGEAATEKQPDEVPSTTTVQQTDGMVFVDWTKPHLVNVCPLSSVITLEVSPGTSGYKVDNPDMPTSGIVAGPADDDSTFILQFDPLLRTIHITAPRLPLYVSGDQVEPGIRTLLSHNDRVHIGAVILRLAYSAMLPDAPEFSVLYHTLEHVDLAEDYHRKYVTHLWAEGISSMLADFCEAEGAIQQKEHNKDDGAGDDTDKVAQTLVGQLDELRDVSVSTLAEQRAAETNLAAQYPINSDELAAHARRSHGKDKQPQKAGKQESTVEPTPALEDEEIDVILNPPEIDEQSKYNAWLEEGMEEYDAARKEQEEALARKQEMISDLKMKLEQVGGSSAPAQKEQTEGVSEDAVAELAHHAEEAVRTEAEVNRQLGEELQYHQLLKRLEQPHPEGPEDEASKERWERFAVDHKSTMPYLSEMHDEQEAYYSSKAASETRGPKPVMHARRGTFYKMKQSKPQWEARYFILTGQFLYYFYSVLGTNRCLGALYLPGAEISPLNRSHAGKKHVMLLKTAVPRRKDSPDQCSFYFAFECNRDLVMWCHWMAVAACPPAPPSIASRVLEEARELRKTGQLTPDTIIQYPQYFSLPPEEWGEVCTAVTVQGDASMGTWKSDDTTDTCEFCEGKFTFFNRRHHCRVCGGIFCDSCCPKSSGNRVCKRCKQECEAEGVGKGVGDGTLSGTLASSTVALTQGK